MPLSQFCFDIRKIYSFPGIFLFFAFESTTIAGSSDSLHLINNLRLGAEVQYGTVLPHSKTIEYSLKENIHRYELTLATDTYGHGSWDQWYRFPRMGAGYLFTSLGNKKVFGHANALFLFMDIPFSRTANTFFASYQISFGIAYLDRVFDINKNPLNMAISSGLNVYGCFNINAKYKIGSRNEIRAGFGFAHFSNGKLATPNLGINSFTFSAGYSCLLTEARYARIIHDSKPKLERHQLEVVFSAGTKTDDQVTGNYYLISTLVADYKYVTGLKYATGAGIDLFYDRSLGTNKVADEGGSYSTADLFQEGIHGAFYVRYSRLNILIQVGGYIHANYFKYSRIYSRIGFRYEILPDIMLNLSLKSHYAIADYVEWGICYRFKRKIK